MTNSLRDTTLDGRFDEIQEALEAEWGDVTRAARILGVRPVTLRKAIAADEKLQEVCDEIMEQTVDKAISVLRKGMDEDSYLVRFYAAKEFVRHEAGRKRGFGAPPRIEAAIQAPEGSTGGVIVLKWIDDDDRAVIKPKAQDQKLIEGEKLG